MATFQPENGILNSKSDYTRSSQGFKADVSSGTLLEGIGSTLDGAVKAGASLFKEIIRDDITKRTDEIQDMFLGKGPTPGSGQDPKKPLPQDIVARAERLQALTDGYHSGRVSSSHYWTLLDTEARAMRSKYAGHREEIDNIFQDLTGAVPANRLIAELKQESTKKDAAAQEYRHWEDKAFGSPEYTAAVERGYKPSQEELKKWGSSWSLRKAKVDVLTNEMNYREKETQIGQKRAVDNVNSLTVDIIQDVWRKGQAASSVDLQKLQDQAEEYRKAGKPIPTELTKSMEGLAAAADAEIAKNVEAFLNQPRIDDGTGKKIPLVQYLNKESLQAVRENADANRKALTTPLRNADFGLMSHNDRMVKLNDSGDLSNLLASEPVISGIRAFEKAVGPQVAQTYFNQQPGALKAMDDFAFRMITSKANRPTTIDQDLQETKVQLSSKGKAYDEKAVARETVKSYMKVLENPATLPEGRTLVYNKLFSTPDFYQKLDNAKDREAVYAMLVNPQTVKDVMSRGSDADKQKYARWVDTVAGIRLGEPATTISERVVKDPESLVSVKYDPNSFTFSADLNGEQRRLGKGQFVGMGDNTGAALNIVDDATKSLNNTLQGYAAVARAQGKTPDQINQTIQRAIQVQGGFDIYNIKKQTKAATPAKGMSAFEPRATDPSAEDNTK